MALGVSADAADTAVPAPAKPAALLKFESTLPQLSSGARCRIENLRSKLRAELATSSPEPLVPQTLLMNAGLGPLQPGSDISELAFVVLMEATSDQDADLELIMAQTKAQNAAKQALRTLIAEVGRDVAANAAQQIDDADGMEAAGAKLPPGPCVSASVVNRSAFVIPTPEPASPRVDAGRNDALSHNAIFLARRQSIQSHLSPRIAALVAQAAQLLSPQAYPVPNADPAAIVATQLRSSIPNATPAQMSLLQLVAIQEALQSQLDSMNEMSEMTSLRLQMAMDRRSKFVEALSNMMKSISDTQDSIVQNLK